MAAVNRPPLPILAARGSLSLDLIQGKDAFTENSPLMRVQEKCTAGKFSKDGSLFAYCDGVKLYVKDVSNGKTVCELDKQRTCDIVFSAKNTYMAAWQAFFTTPQNPQGDNNYEIYKISTGEVKKSIIHKRQPGWAPQWTDDEKVCGRFVNNEVQFYENDEFGTASKKLYIQGVAGFAIAPGGPPYYIAANVKGKKGAPSFVRLYQFPHLGEYDSIANKSFFKADKVDMFWNKRGTALLILTSLEVDASGASYYGEQSLHYMDVTGESSLVPFDKKGPIYSVEWNPNSAQFCVVYGFMPAKATLFNTKCEPVFDFGTGPRNMCAYNVHGNILCLGGFGNLRGVLELWNLKEKRIISKPQAEDTTYLEWCPDGEHFLTATLAPRLRIANGYKIWHFTGKEVFKYSNPPNTEMWQTTWQPYPAGSFPEPKLPSAGTPIVQAAKKEAYRPPSARGTPKVSLKLHDEEKPQNQRESEGLSAAAMKNKKKREAKAKAKQEQQVNGDSTPAATDASPSSILTSEPQLTGDPETDKKIKGLRKKLQQIEKLKGQVKEGKQLEKNQLDKLKTEKDIVKELQALTIGS